MNTKTPIKIIKRGERKRQAEATAEVAAAAEKKTPQEAARDMVATVTDWVNEFQQKRRVETRQALRNFLTETRTQTS